MAGNLAKVYDPKIVEDKIYKFWLDGGYFHTNIDSNKIPYTIVMPPPNITGQLHMGHALDETLQDIIIRFKRMQGYAALWVPGTDHASIATEAKVVEALKKEGISKESIGREEFLKHVWKWKQKYGNRIVEQLKKLGSSCDWDRERFTMDEGCANAVKEVFVRLYEKGLIYRGERIINWCPNCKTSISDAEVEFVEHNGSFWYIKYPLTDGSGYLEIATTRPETMLGDTALAVNPNDDRYKQYIGKSVKLPLSEREIPIIGDNYVEQDFGTGVVKITPAHDPNDFEVGIRHNLPIINIMESNAIMNNNAGKYKGLDRYEARKQVVKDLEEMGYLIKVETIKHNVSSCYRCSNVVEPRISEQWFVKMKQLAEPAINSVKNGEVEFIPNRFSKVYYNWMENIKDWCISRQLWWGHRIPAYYCSDCGEVIVSRQQIDKCTKCGSYNIKQDEDTLDTWFSSALWPFSTLGWPEDTKELKYFYPTNTLVTGYDIIFFWVARMIFSGIEHTGKPPFKTVLMHGLVRDSQGRKMSKSLGNGVDPLEVIENYGADALRFSLATGNSPGNDIRFSNEKIASSRNFANKIWNAARFIHMNIDDYDVKNELPENLEIEDKWIISELNKVIKEVTDNIEHFELGIAVQKLYDFIWDYFCDWYIELAKIRLMSNNDSSKDVRQVLVWTMDKILKLLHPFMPYITEEIWQTMPHDGSALIISKYPQYNENYLYDKESEEMKNIMLAIKAIRNRRAEMNVPPSKKANVYIATKLLETFNNGKSFISKLAYSSNVEVAESFNLSDAVNIITDTAKIYIPMNELIDAKSEITRLNKELEIARKEFKLADNKLNNQGFLSKAPESVIKSTKETLLKMKEKINLIESSIEKLNNM